MNICCFAKAKRPTDANQRAVLIAKIATGEIEDPVEEKDPVKAAASMLGRLGGLKGGNARAKKLTAKKRSDIAKKAAAARWKK
ncbi:MAG TPA: hypothetical protein VNV85_02960 [Puia sp.]|nr:hypothetical protein [Puia sp.]